jgi:hypothetical protein
MGDRFKVDQFENGQIYVTEKGEHRLHAQINGEHDVEIQVGVRARVMIDKLYGPLVFWPIRVSMDFDTCEWVIERQFGPEGVWREAVRIPGQLDSDFSD